MWLALAFLSAFFLGCYDISKKKSVQGNAIIPVLFLNTLFCTLLLSPLLLLSRLDCALIRDTVFYLPEITAETHTHAFLKAALVLSSWIFGYAAVKYLPLTITGPINATRPVITLAGALLLFGERLNLYQWAGALLTIVSIFLLSVTSKKEGLVFRHNKWVLFMFIAALLGAASSLYDKYLMRAYNSTAIQFWYSLYQCILMLGILAVLWRPKRASTTPFQWRWNILLVSLFLCVADFIYFYALSASDAMISIVSMVRRGSVVVSFAGGILFFNEKNLKGKLLDLVLIIIGMFFLYLGTK
ncbi:MAG: DMT family transporter [Prevotella sp.]|jgi:transporter family protein|nr:DMT family transporter [Prevotella sp.]